MGVYEMNARHSAGFAPSVRQRNPRLFRDNVFQRFRLVRIPRFRRNVPRGKVRNGNASDLFVGRIRHYDHDRPRRPVRRQARQRNRNRLRLRQLKPVQALRGNRNLRQKRPFRRVDAACRYRSIVGRREKGILRLPIRELRGIPLGGVQNTPEIRERYELPASQGVTHNLFPKWLRKSRKRRRNSNSLPWITSFRPSFPNWKRSKTDTDTGRTKRN